MSREQRAALREAVDQAVRADIEWDALERCQGCGGELADDFGRALYVEGCPTCVDRAYKRTERESLNLTVQLALPVAA